MINTRGLKGEIKLYLYTDDPDHRFHNGQILYVDQKDPVTIRSFSMHKGFGYVRLQGVDTIEQAELLKEHDLYIKKEDLPSLESGHYYYYQLMDCDVYNRENEYLGRVTDLLETGVHPVLRIEDGNHSFLCPYAPAFIVSVDPQEKKIVIEEMEGLR